LPQINPDDADQSKNVFTVLIRVIRADLRQKFLYLSRQDLVVIDCGLDNFVAFFTAVGIRDLADIRLVGQGFVGQEVVLEAFENAGWQLRYLGVLFENFIALEHGDYLVISLAAIDQAKTTDRCRLQNNVAARDVVFAQNENVQRIVIAVAYRFTALPARHIRDILTTICSRNKPVIRRNDIRILLRTIDLEIAGFLINLIFYRVLRHDLDKNSYLVRCSVADRNAMPRMSFVALEHIYILSSIATHRNIENIGRELRNRYRFLCFLWVYVVKSFSMRQSVSLEYIDRTLIVRFTRPEIRNPLSVAVLDQLHATVGELKTNREVKKIVFTGTDDSFASGADLREIANVTGENAPGFALYGQSLMAKVAALPQQTIAAINGWCFGGALDLALSCKVRIASPNARFAHPGAGLGIITGWGGTQRLPRLIGQGNALEMFFTASPIDAVTALRFGLVDEIADDPLETALRNADLGSIM